METMPLILLILLIAALVGVIVYLAGKTRQAVPDRDPVIPPPSRDPNKRETHNVTIQPGPNNGWQVRVENQKPGFPLRVHRGDEVVWRFFEDTRVRGFFQFPSGELFNQLPGCDPWTTDIGSGSELEELRVTVSENALPGIHTYAVFVLQNDDAGCKGSYAEGGSPPRMIIKHD